MRLILAAAIVTTLSGCGFYHWHKDGASAADFQRDQAACQSQGSAAQWNACMTGKGWIYSSGW